MLTPRNIPWPRLSLLTHVGLLVLLIAGVCGAQPEAIPEPALRAPLLDASHVRRVYRALEQWIAAGKVPQADDAEAVLVTGLLGVRVTIRSMGMAVGVGDSTFDSDGTFEPVHPANLMAVTRKAAERAIEDFSVRAAEQARTADDPMRGALKLTDLESLLTVDLQVGHTLQTVMVREEADTEELIRQYAAGFHGLRMVRPVEEQDDRRAWSWPASNLATNFSPPQQIVQLMRSTGYRPEEDVPRVGKADGPRLQRFEVLHFVRSSPNQPVEQLVRGNIVLPVAQVNTRTLEAVEQRLALHLVKLQRGNGTFYGAFQPSKDEIASSATVDETALAAYVLAHYDAGAGPMPWTGDERDSTPGEAARRTINLLMPRLIDPQEQPRPRAWALALMLVLEWADAAEHNAQRDALYRLLMTMRGPDRIFLDGRGVGAKPLEATTQAMIVAAITRLYDRTRDPALGKDAAESLEALWGVFETAPVIDGLAWVAEAELRMTALSGKPRAEARKKHEQRLQLVRDALMELQSGQITEAPELGPADVVGGFDLAPASASGAPYPNWQSVHALILMTKALREPELRGERDPLRLTVECAMAARFLAQLMLDQPGCFYIRQPGLALGGVRRSLVDNTIAIEPTALTLLAITDLRRALDELERDAANR